MNSSYVTRQNNFELQITKKKFDLSPQTKCTVLILYTYQVSTTIIRCGRTDSPNVVTILCPPSILPLKCRIIVAATNTSSQITQKKPYTIIQRHYTILRYPSMYFHKFFFSAKRFTQMTRILYYTHYTINLPIKVFTEFSANRFRDISTEIRLQSSYNFQTKPASQLDLV